MKLCRKAEEKTDDHVQFFLFHEKNVIPNGEPFCPVPVRNSVFRDRFNYGNRRKYGYSNYVDVHCYLRSVMRLSAGALVNFS